MTGLRTLLPLLAAFACCSADAAPRAAASRPAREPEILAKIMRHPLIFFVAKGEPNACGPHCSEWIAAEGNIDTDAAKRFREFLDQPARRNLPVFFNSLGGSTNQAAIIGRLLRQYRMTAGVARTIPQGCRAALSMDDACRRIAQSTSEHKARLVTSGARCASGCVYAILGASVRQVNKAAELGIHSARYLWVSHGPPKSAPPSIDVAHERLRNYAVEMGTDPSLVDAAAKVSADRIHWMTRAEIDRFGIETRGFYETRWTPLQETSVTYSIAKSWTQPGEGGGDFRTGVIRLRCSVTASKYLLTYRNELPLFQSGERMRIGLESGGDTLQLRPGMMAETGSGMFFITVDRETMQKVAAGSRLSVTEIQGWAVSRTFELSTAGLSDALGQLQKRCDKREETGTAAVAPTR
jgi:hypothetical protein